MSAITLELVSYILYGTPVLPARLTPPVAPIRSEAVEEVTDCCTAPFLYELDRSLAGRPPAGRCSHCREMAFAVYLVPERRYDAQAREQEEEAVR